MSQKITAKNLTFERSIPPFLAALQGQVAGGSSPDPILSGRRRAVKPRSGSAEAEDAPLVLDDEGNVVSGVKIGLDGAVTETGEAGPALADRADEEKAGEGPQKTETEKVAGIGASKKRKAGKVVGAEADGDEEAGAAGSTKDKSKATPGSADGEKQRVAKGKKKAKKIKLSFGDGDAD